MSAPLASENSEDILNSQGLFVLCDLFGDDDDFASVFSNSEVDTSDDDCTDHNAHDNDDEDDDADGDDNNDDEDNDDDNDGDDMVTPEAGIPESASAGPDPASLGTPESASADLVPTSPAIVSLLQLNLLMTVLLMSLRWNLSLFFPPLSQSHWASQFSRTLNLSIPSPDLV